MKFSMLIPVGDIRPGEFQSAAAIAEMASALEAAKVEACFLTDHPAPSAEWLHANGHDALDPFTALAFIAANSSRLRLLTNILVLPYRNPFLTAKAAATLQVLSGGRLILGVGGGYQKLEFDALGVEFSKRGELFDEALKVIRMAWSGDVVVQKGSNFNAIGNQPRPVPNPQPPIWIGGSSDKAVQRAAQSGDGWCPFFATPILSKSNRDIGLHSVEHLGEKIMQLMELREAQGKTGEFDIAIGPRNVTNHRTCDGAEMYLEAMNKYAEVGVTCATVVLPSPSRQAYLENVGWFGEEVIARSIR
jgi:probable F420-dependent oxidoreductase